ncbi:ferredoxin [Leucobacter weissii]|uniref:Ferredoxin n=1 Tax=Leucobacter weissii TaxID=1983706 RepID=A0A939MM46_9MICO|nr:ferredoxin [Leucobacter weissii]MBO1901322.1 ferredoxin [Leucobacter weissii]
MRIEARQHTCIGSGQCVFTDPDAFDQDDNGIVQVLRPNPEGPEQEALARQAMQVCPSRSISVVED